MSLGVFDDGWVGSMTLGRARRSAGENLIGSGRQLHLVAAGC